MTINSGATVTTANDNVFGTTTAANMPDININGGTLTSGSTGGLWFKGITMTGGTINGTGHLDFQATSTGINTLASASTATISVGTFALNSPAVFNVADGAAATDLLVTSKMSGASTLTKNGVGLMQLSGTNTYTGVTSINAGTLQLDFSQVDNSSAPASNILAGTGTVTLGGGTLALKGNGATGASQNLANLTTTANTISGIVLNPNGAGTLTLTINAGALTAPTFGASSNLILNTVAGGNNGATVGNAIMVWNTGVSAGTMINAGFLVTDAGGTGFATDNVSNQIIRLTPSTLLPASGATSGINYNINNNAGGSGAAGSSNLTLSATEAAASITVDTTTASGTLSLGANTLNNDNWLFTAASGTNTYTINSTTGNLKSVTSGDAMTFNNVNPGTVTINAPILANGTNAVNFKGAGTTVLTASNTYTGVTTIYNTLQIGNGGTTGTLGSGNVTDNGSLIFNRSDNAYTYAGVISSTGTLIQNGPGTITLSGANSYTGGTTVSAGTLVMVDPFTGSAWTVNGGTKTIVNGATLQFQGTAGASNLVNAGSISLNSGGTLSLLGTGSNGLQFGTGSTISGSGTIFVPSSNVLVDFFNYSNELDSFTGSINVQGGTLQFVTPSSATSAGSGSITLNVATGATLDIRTGILKVDALSGGGTITSSSAADTLNLGNNNGSATFSGTIANGAGSIALIKNGTGTQTLTGTNTYTGVTTISGGVLQIGNGGASGSLGAGATTDNASLVFNRSDNAYTYAGAISGSGSLTMNGTGTVGLSGVNSYTGTTTINTGRLQLVGGVTNDYTASSVFNIASGATLEINQTSGSIRLRNGNSQITGSGTVQKTGAGLTFLANNSSSVQVNFNMSAGGLVDIQGGTFESMSTTAGNLASLNIASGATASLNNGGGSATNDFFDALTGAGTLTLDGAATRTITIGANNGGGLFSGVINNVGTLSFVKIGAGTETLSGASSYTGGTSINGGALSVTADNNLGAQARCPWEAANCSTAALGPATSLPPGASR